MPSCHSLCKANSDAIPQEGKGRHICTICANAVHSVGKGCCVGPICDYPEYEPLGLPNEGVICLPCDARLQEAATRESDDKDDDAMPESDDEDRKPPAKRSRAAEDCTFLPPSVLAPGAYIAHKRSIPVPQVPDLPDSDINVSFEFMPPKITLMKDGTLAVASAIKNVFHDSQLNELTCGVHGSTLWFQKNFGLFKGLVEDKKILVEKFVSHFCAFRDNCVTDQLVPVFRAAMYRMWVEDFEETDVADQWMVFWGQQHLTRVEANKFSPIGGGMPTDNNAIEVSNRVDKDSWERNRHHILQFIEVLEARIRQRSQLDKDFGKSMKHKVHSQVFFGHVLSINNKMKQNLACFLNITWSITKQHRLSKYYSVGSKLVASGFLLNKEKDRFTRGGKQIMDLDSIVNLVERCGYKDFIMLHHSPASFSNWAFERLDSLCRSFYILSPILALEQIAATWYMLTSNGYVLKPLDVLISNSKSWKTSEGFVSCTCGTFRHYCWCVHAAAVALNREVVEHIPRTMVPSSLADVTGRVQGRPTTARGGEALMRY
jgi:SWIM zinc finger